MSTWEQFQSEAPQLAAHVQARFTSAKHHVLATIRRDGSPRVSGTEVGFTNGELHVGSMPEAMKALDLRRDPRCALHAHTGDGSMAGGDAKLAGRMIEVLDDEQKAPFVMDEQPPGPFHLFLLDITEATVTTVEGDLLVMEHWRPREGVRRHERS